MLKTTLATLIALTLVAAAGCGKDAPPAGEAAPGTPAAAGAMPPHPVPAAPADSVDLSGIAKAEGGRTVAEIYADKAGLAGQTVIFRGKVVKTNAGIMNLNWLHVRDGSGEEGTNDLTVTTTDPLPAVGDTVLVTGTVALDRDFGMGYTYGILVEQAKLAIEPVAAP